MERTLPALVTVLGLLCWTVFLSTTLRHVVGMTTDPTPPFWYLYDWNVHWAGALDWRDRDLYQVPLRLNAPLPSYTFNLPPGSAMLALPFLPLGREVGGVVWVLVGVGSLSGAALAASRWLPVRHGWAWMGLGMAVYTTTVFYVGHVVLGNVNHVMLALLVGFAWAHLGSHQRAAGVLLGLAIGIKAWPFVLAVVLVRERRWLSLAWTGGVVAAVGLVTLAWLGPDVIAPMVGALRAWLPVHGADNVLWTSWLREMYGAPAWLGPLLAVILLLLPTRGMLGIGVGIVAGVSLVNNIWTHYLPTLALGLLLVTIDLERAFAVSRPSSATTPSAHSRLRPSRWSALRPRSGTR